MPDDRLGEQLVLFVEQEEPYDFHISEEDMKVFKPYEFPRKIISVPQFQRTSTGKIQRGQTLTKYLDTI
jgi:O-succinylbenzoic acid--CoA ligase